MTCIWFEDGRVQNMRHSYSNCYCLKVWFIPNYLDILGSLFWHKHQESHVISVTRGETQARSWSLKICSNFCSGPGAFQASGTSFWTNSRLRDIAQVVYLLSVPVWICWSRVTLQKLWWKLSGDLICWCSSKCSAQTNRPKSHHKTRIMGGLDVRMQHSDLTGVIGWLLRTAGNDNFPDLPKQEGNYVSVFLGHPLKCCSVV